MLWEAHTHTQKGTGPKTRPFSSLCVFVCDWQVLCGAADPQQQPLHGGGGQQV